MPKLYGTYDRGVALPLGHSSIWSRSAAGFSPQRPRPAVRQLLLRRLRQQLVDHRDEKRYREWYSFPGAELNEIGGRNFVKSGVEWNAAAVAVPPRRHAGVLRDLGAAGGVRHRRSSTNLDAPDARRVVTDTGGQIDFRFGALSALELTLSVGGAVALERGQPPRREAMMSLKILR